MTSSHVSDEDDELPRRRLGLGTVSPEVDLPLDDFEDDLSLEVRFDDLLFEDLPRDRDLAALVSLVK